MLWNPAPGDPTLGARSQPPTIVPRPLATGASATPEVAAHTTLVLYDTSGSWGFLGELYATGAANLASHFGDWEARPVSAYECGDAMLYRAVLYIGSSFDEPLSACMVSDMLATTRPVVWAGYNLWRLGTGPAFTTRFGFSYGGLDTTAIGSVLYKGETLARYAGNLSGIAIVNIVNPAQAIVLASAVRADRTTIPWATRSGNFIFVGEVPFTYMSEEDRAMIYADLLFDALAPDTLERHRALVRLEDIDPTTDPAALRAIADLLYSRNIPFGFAVVPEFRDPLGESNGGVPLNRLLTAAPQLVSALTYLQSRGGIMVLHGQTHQWDGGRNPYTQMTGDDDEFFRVIENADSSLTFVGPVPEDSTAWAVGRMNRGIELLGLAGFAAPGIFEFPHYAASAVDYRAVSARFATRWERVMYFNGVLSGGTVNYANIFGQLFPYVVRDVYGTRVLPENLGNIEPIPFYTYPTRLPPQIIRAAGLERVVRDGIAGLYFHSFFDIAYLHETIDGVLALGYTFVSPNAAAADLP